MSKEKYCSPYEHVFDGEDKRVCLCGMVKTVSCECVCGNRHRKEAATTVDDRLNMLATRVEDRLSKLEAHLVKLEASLVQKFSKRSRGAEME